MAKPPPRVTEFLRLKVLTLKKTCLKRAVTQEQLLQGQEAGFPEQEHPVPGPLSWELFGETWAWPGLLLAWAASQSE